ncbi:transcriptional regulator [Nocardioides sp. KIGAM211]|uniref:Transcriptional regulator n=1 Tax=Nocardioides luti TaxID=2761101 RepID=A0A7X0RDP8_9ACTN|nr:transcriptional regulator [Nocardioides luti]MBB6626386.1 transcriptional regulator [Nocardioides luti]
MTRSKRWCVVAAVTLLVILAPLAWRALPADDDPVSAADLVARVRASDGHAYSGFVESQGALQLPVTSKFTDVGALVGERTRMRVWWRGERAWRVDKLLVSGETDLVHADALTTQWDYEDATARQSVDPQIRLPRTADLLPPALGHRLLEDVDAGDLARLPARRVAGRDALGLRLSPGAPQSSIDHVDLWVDRDTAVPLRVEVYDDAGDRNPVFVSQFRSFDPATPSVEDTSFRAPPGTDLSFEEVLDIADAANQYAPVIPPATVGGLAKSPDADRAVGIYGTGVTQLITIPLRDREADPLREQLGTTIGSHLVEGGTVVAVGPLGLLLTGAPGDGGWLIAGTVTEETLVRAAADLASGTRYVDGAGR